MTDSDPRDRRRAQANAIRIKASPLRVPAEEFARHFRDRHIVAAPEQRGIIEQMTQEMFCDSCWTPTEYGTYEGSMLYVRIEDDPLRNFWKLAHANCFHCGFTEIIPLEAPTYDPSAEANMAGMGGVASMMGSPGPVFYTQPALLTEQVDVWLAELRRQEQEHIRNQVLAQNVAKAQAIRSMSGQQAMTATQLRHQMMAGMISPPPPTSGSPFSPNDTFEGFPLKSPPTDPVERANWIARLTDFMRRKSP